MKSVAWKFKIATVPQQENTTDCGVFALQHMKFSIFGEEFPKCTLDDVKNIRFTMVLELAEQAIRWKNGLHGDIP